MEELWGPGFGNHVLLLLLGTKIVRGMLEDEVNGHEDSNECEHCGYQEPQAMETETAIPERLLRDYRIVSKSSKLGPGDDGNLLRSSKSVSLHTGHPIDARVSPGASGRRGFIGSKNCC